MVEAVHETAVAVDSHLDRGVAESGLNGLGVFSCGDEPCGVGVAQAMECGMAARRIRLRANPVLRFRPELSRAPRRFCRDGAGCYNSAMVNSD